MAISTIPTIGGLLAVGALAIGSQVADPAAPPAESTAYVAPGCTGSPAVAPGARFDDPAAIAWAQCAAAASSAYVARASWENLARAFPHR